MKTIISTLILTLVFGGFTFVNAQKKQQIKVLINRQKAVPGTKLTIKFVSLLEDSRCAPDNNCIQAGNARITIKVSKQNGAAEILELHTNSDAQSIAFAGYQIKLVDLSAGAAANANGSGYIATFVVSKSANPK